MKKLFASFDKLRILKHGTLGFIIFFSIVLLSKLFSSLFFTHNKINIEFQDILISSIGFFLVALVKIIEKFSNTQNT